VARGPNNAFKIEAKKKSKQGPNKSFMRKYIQNPTQKPIGIRNFQRSDL